MEETFDIRLATDREALADRLPSIDGNEFHLSRQDFISALNDLVEFLGDQDWMVYQWGCFVPVLGVPGYSISLPMAIELGIQLRHLSQYENFEELVKSFANPPQFLASSFETKVAFYLSLLGSVDRLKFSPAYEVRGRDKEPDFDLIGAFGIISVECKQPNIYRQKTMERVDKTVSEFQSAMKQSQWPKNLRLEVEISDPLKGSQSELTKKIVETSLRLFNNKADQPFFVHQVQCFVVQKSSPFHLIQKKGFLTNVLTPVISAGQDSPEATFLRVIDKRYDSQIIKGIGTNINEALSQLPESHDCLIVVGVDSPFLRFAIQACERRLSVPDYNHVRGIGLWSIEQTEPIFVCKKPDEDYLRQLIGIDSQEV